MTTAAVPAVEMPEPPLADIEITISDRPEDVDEALRVVHDGFVEAGFMAPRPSGRRMHLSYLNPGTTFFVARMDGEPVGASALVADGPFGLPSDRAFAEENDALRRAGSGVVHESGSLSVLRTHRRHTRRILMRLIAAMSRVTLADYPTAPIPIAVAPENLRFYQALVDAELVGESRLLYGAPAILMVTNGLRIHRHATARRTPIARTMDLLCGDPHPDWLADRRTGEALPAGWLAPLLRECDGVSRLLHQAAVLEAVAAGAEAPPVAAPGGVLAA